MPRAKPYTKPGEHGPLYRFVIEYGDPGESVMRWQCWAYDAEHALEKFNDSDEGFTAFRYCKRHLLDASTPRDLSYETWHKVN